MWFCINHETPSRRRWDDEVRLATGAMDTVLHRRTTTVRPNERERLVPKDVVVVVVVVVVVIVLLVVAAAASSSTSSFPSQQAPNKKSNNK